MNIIGAVIGATVARETGLTVGSTFQPAHGVGPDAHEHDPFTVLGVLKPTGTPNDRGLFINMEGFYLIPEHAKPVDEDAPVAAKPAATEHEEHKHAENHADEHAKEDAHAEAGEHEHAADEHAKDDYEEHKGNEDGKEHEHAADEAHEHAADEHDDHAEHEGHAHEGHDGTP